LEARAHLLCTKLLIKIKIKQTKFNILILSIKKRMKMEIERKKIQKGKTSNFFLIDSECRTVKKKQQEKKKITSYRLTESKKN
jgi:hypothetical protein